MLPAAGHLVLLMLMLPLQRSHPILQWQRGNTLVSSSGVSLLVFFLLVGARIGMRGRAVLLLSLPDLRLESEFGRTGWVSLLMLMLLWLKLSLVGVVKEAGARIDMIGNVLSMLLQLRARAADQVRECGSSMLLLVVVVMLLLVMMLSLELVGVREARVRIVLTGNGLLVLVVELTHTQEVGAVGRCGRRLLLLCLVGKEIGVGAKITGQRSGQCGRRHAATRPEGSCSALLIPEARAAGTRIVVELCG